MARPTLRIDESDVNRLAQLFYERSGIVLASMLDKPKVVAGLTAVLGELDIAVTPARVRITNH